MKKTVTAGFFILFLVLIPMVSVAQQGQPMQPEQPAMVNQQQQPEPQRLAEPPQQQPKPVLVGRISEVVGPLVRYVPDINDWSATEKDNPFGVKDALSTGESAKAEFLFPNNTLIRIGSTTQIQLVRLDVETIEADVSSGTARFYNKGTTIVKCTVPIGYVLAESGTVFDVIVGTASVEVVAIKGQVSFIHTGLGNSKYDVIAGSGSIVADSAEVTAGTVSINPDWVAWNDQRDNLWTTRQAKTTESAKYVPQGMQQESYVLAENGRWENVVYEGQPRSLWRPTVVAASWSPFTNGRWVSYYGDQVWVPNEPFGYVTHHYGNWVMVDSCNCWYWAPPVTQYVATGPYLPIEYAWYPGRVSWVSTDVSVGWVPLHYSDPYYSPYWDSYYTYYGYDHHDHHDHHEHYNNYYGGDYTNINVNVNNLHYGDHAVVVSKANLYTSHDGYNNVRMNVRRQDLGSYHSQGRLNHDVVKNTGREGYQFSSKPAHFKPDQSANTRIKQNQMASRVRQGDNAKGYRNTMQQAKSGKMSSGPARSFQSVNRPQQGQHQQMQQNRPQPFQQKQQQMQQNKPQFQQKQQGQQPLQQNRPQPFQQKQQQMQQNKPQLQQKQQRQQQQQQRQPQQQKRQQIQQNKPQLQQKQQKQQSQPAKNLNNKDKKIQ